MGAVQNTAFKCLRTWDHDPIDVGNIILRMALSNETPSSAAVLKSLLAISSLHRYGLHVQVANLKISALSAMAKASNGSLNKDEAKQHVAAGMLLYSLEVCTMSSSLVGPDFRLNERCDLHRAMQSSIASFEPENELSTFASFAISCIWSDCERTAKLQSPYGFLYLSFRQIDICWYITSIMPLTTTLDTRCFLHVESMDVAYRWSKVRFESCIL